MFEKSILDLLKFAKGVCHTLIRIEHKLDLLLKLSQKEEFRLFDQINFNGEACPVCNKPAKYEVEVNSDPPRMTRTCGCDPKVVVGRRG